MKDANRELADLRQLHAQVEVERDSLAAKLKGTENDLHNAAVTHAIDQTALNLLRTKMEKRLRDLNEDTEYMR